MLESPGRRGQPSTHHKVWIESGAEPMLPKKTHGGVEDEETPVPVPLGPGRGRKEPGSGNRLEG